MLFRSLVHISALADKFVKDPRDVVKAGDIVRVKVLEVDIPRKRIALTMRLGDEPTKNRSPSENPRRSNQGATNRQRPEKPRQSAQQPAKTGTLGALFAEALKKP